MSIRIALAGNPNSGKTTMFNELTGSAQYVGNWPGVTVEKKEGRLKSHRDVTVVDLPGIYSLSPYTLEEVVTRNYLLDEKPDVIVNIVDASNLERNLYLTTQLAEVGLPVIVALNMMDIVKKRGDSIDIQKLSKELGALVVPTAAVSGQGLEELIAKAIELAGQKKPAEIRHSFSKPVEETLAAIGTHIQDAASAQALRWYTIKLFERDKEAAGHLPLEDTVKAEIERLILACEEQQDDDSESIITNERYTYIGGVIQNSLVKKDTGMMSTSDKIDRIVTNRILALPIFFVVMWIVYYISISTVGTMATDWVNDSLFGDGFHLLSIGSAEYEDAAGEFEIDQLKIDSYIEAAADAGMDIEAEPEEWLPAAREQGLQTVLEVENEDGVEESLPVTADDFEAALAAEEPEPADYGIWVPGIPAVVEGWLVAADAADWLQGLILEGIIGGVGAVLGFLPQMLVLFFFLALLEDSGYMARIAFIMDRIFRRFGLSGKSFIPILVGTGCGVPGIMATRTIENEKDRRMTIIVTTFIPCGAKLPIIALIAGALFPDASWVGPSAYFAGIAAIIISGIFLKRTRLFAGDPAPFVMELPQYHLPKLKGVLVHMWSRGKSFVKKAGTIIFVSCAIIWFLQSFDWSLNMVDAGDSILATLGNLIAPLFIPLGWGEWRAAVATITGLVAKENVVGTFGVLYGFAEVAEDGVEIWGTLREAFTQVSAYSFLIFNLLCAPCFAAIGAVKREMGSWKWTLIAVGYQTLFAYVAALLVYQIGSLIF